jgi:hypothetical protein
VLRRILTRVVLWTLALSMLLMIPFVNELGRTLDARTSGVTDAPAVAVLHRHRVAVCIVDNRGCDPLPHRRRRVRNDSPR